MTICCCASEDCLLDCDDKGNKPITFTAFAIDNLPLQYFGLNKDDFYFDKQLNGFLLKEKENDAKNFKNSKLCADLILFFRSVAEQFGINIPKYIHNELANHRCGLIKELKPSYIDNLWLLAGQKDNRAFFLKIYINVCTKFLTEINSACCNDKKISDYLMKRYGNLFEKDKNGVRLKMSEIKNSEWVELLKEVELYKNCKQKYSTINNLEDLRGKSGSLVNG